MWPLSVISNICVKRFHTFRSYQAYIFLTFLTNIASSSYTIFVVTSGGISQLLVFSIMTYTVYSNTRINFSPAFGFFKYIHNIHNWPLQPFSQDYGLASHTTYVVCVNFFLYMSGGTYNLKSTPNDEKRKKKLFFIRNLF